MDKIIAYVDDAEFAAHHLAPMKQHAADTTTHWILVACPPRMTRHISKWVSHSARQNWRSKWADTLLEKIRPVLDTRDDRISLVLSQGPLIEQTQRLLLEHGVARVLDARRPKFGQDLAPVTPDQPTSHSAAWTSSGAVAGMGVALVLASE